MGRRARTFLRGWVLGCLVCLIVIPAAWSRSYVAAKKPFDLPADTAARSLKRFSEQAGLQVVFASHVTEGIRTHAVKGDLFPRQALDAMLLNTSLVVIQDETTGAFAVRRETAQEKNDPRAGAEHGRSRSQDSANGQSAPNSPPTASPQVHGAGVRLGSIAGWVSNAATGAYLEGAQVRLEPGQVGALTSRDGHFLFSNLSPGEYRVTISYTGLDTQTLPLALAPGQAATREVALTSQIYSLEAFTVAGEREGNALAITQQRNAPNVKNVLASDAFGNIADQNIGNLLTQLPGISEFVDEGEVTRVNIRGISPDMNAVTVDGTRSASGVTGVMDRGFSLDRIPADFVERIEVTKALTPDMDGDSIGGAINLRTKSPLDRKGRYIAYMGGTSWNLDRNTFQPIASFSFSDIYGVDQKLGVLVTSSYNKTHKPRAVVFKNWEPTTDTDRPVYFWVSNLGEDLLKHERIGLGVRFDYKLSSTHRIFINTMYSHYKDTMDRRQFSAPAPTAATVRQGWTDTVTETVNQTLTYLQNHRKRTVETVNLVLGGEKRFSSSFLDYGFNYSRSAGTEDRVIPNRVVAGVGFRFDRSQSTKFPTIQQISGPDINDLNNQIISALNFQDFDDRDTIKGLHFNWEKRFSVAVPASLKTGVRYRGQERDREQKRSYYAYLGADGVAGVNPATGINDDNVGQFYDSSYRYRAVGRYDPVISIDPDRLVAHWQANPSHYSQNIANTVRDGLRFNGRVTEDVYAAYIMGDVRLGPLDILGGLRVEETRLTGKGVRQEITPEERARRAAWVGPVTPEETARRTAAEWGNLREDSGEYRKVLPSLHFKYNVSNNLLTRLSYSTGIGRPNFTDLLRNTTVNHTNQTVIMANANLRPQYADNFDLSLEYYFEPAGFVSAGVFLKEITDFIYGDRGGVVGDGPDNGFDGEYVGYDLISQFNGGSARVRGFELAYQQRLVWLPGIWQGLGLMANYTRLESRGNYNASGSVTGAELNGFVPETMNLGLSYAYRSWDVRIKMNYRSRHMRAFSSSPWLREYNYSKRNYDINIKYNWKPQISFFVDVINVFDSPIDDNYIYIPSRYRRAQIFTTAIKLGVSGRF